MKEENFVEQNPEIRSREEQISEHNLVHDMLSRMFGDDWHAFAEEYNLPGRIDTRDDEYEDDFDEVDEELSELDLLYEAGLQWFGIDSADEIDLPDSYWEERGW